MSETKPLRFLHRLRCSVLKSGISVPPGNDRRLEHLLQ
jgi:hypothetical protein